MKIIKYSYELEGLIRVYENYKWMVGIKNWKPANDIEGINCLERHNESDELFVLLSGKCVLIYANDVNGELVIEAVDMEPMKVYNIPAVLWHNTVTQKGTKLLLVEDSSTGMDNSDLRILSEEQIEMIKKLVNR